MVGSSARFYAPLFVSTRDLRFVDGIKLCLRIIGAVCVCVCASVRARVLPFYLLAPAGSSSTRHLRGSVRRCVLAGRISLRTTSSWMKQDPGWRWGWARKSCSATSFKRSLAASAEGTNVRRPETSLVCRQPGAPSVIGARVCGCACDNRSKLCVWQREVERVGVGRERANQLISSLEKMTTRQARTEPLGTPCCAREWRVCRHTRARACEGRWGRSGGCGREAGVVSRDSEVRDAVGKSGEEKFRFGLWTLFCCTRGSGEIKGSFFRSGFRIVEGSEFFFFF